MGRNQGGSVGNRQHSKYKHMEVDRGNTRYSCLPCLAKGKASATCLKPEFKMDADWRMNTLYEWTQIHKHHGSE